ncbi:MAG TPA: anti-sigma factor [Methylomirabilota bacterium]|nr:anti-sigma factor [Methylomirabilota bacterium]
MSDHEELEGTVAAWVLGALDADEAESMRVHVEGCATCRQTAARFRRAADSLPLEVEEVVPPARLRERVLIAASAARASTMPSAPARKRAALAPGRWKPVATVQLGRLTAFAAAATVLLALLVGLVVGGMLGRGSVSPPAPQVARFTLAGHGALAAAHGTVIDLKSDGVTLVDFSGLPALDKGKVYEVWLITPGGHPDSAAVFVPDSNGSKVVLVNMPLKGYSQMAVTAEDGPDGSAAPTQQPQLYGALG